MPFSLSSTLVESITWIVSHFNIIWSCQSCGVEELVSIIRSWRQLDFVTNAYSLIVSQIWQLNRETIIFKYHLCLVSNIDCIVKIPTTIAENPNSFINLEGVFNVDYTWISQSINNFTLGHCFSAAVNCDIVMTNSWFCRILPTNFAQITFPRLANTLEIDISGRNQFTINSDFNWHLLWRGDYIMVHSDIEIKNSFYIWMCFNVRLISNGHLFGSTINIRFCYYIASIVF